jgi:hypothetical protein
MQSNSSTYLIAHTLPESPTQTILVLVVCKDRLDSMATEPSSFIGVIVKVINNFVSGLVISTRTLDCTANEFAKASVMPGRILRIITTAPTAGIPCCFAIVKTLTPILSWTFQEEDEENKKRWQINNRLGSTHPHQKRRQTTS